MRNLKKILALVLALVMVVGMMTVATAAVPGTDYSDDAAISAKYDEAVQILSQLGVFRGTGDGSTFSAQTTISRAEVAAIVYRIVTGDVNDVQVGIYKDYNKFEDVDENAWYAGYVNFCANGEYIRGDGAGHFYPDMKVTGYQLLAIILRAIGYGQNGEFEGAGWEIRTASKAKELNITKNITSGTLGADISREVVAEMLYRGIAQTSTVEYTMLLGYQYNYVTLAYVMFGLHGYLVETDITDWTAYEIMTNNDPAVNDGVYGEPVSFWVCDPAYNDGLISVRYNPVLASSTTVSYADVYKASGLTSLAVFTDGSDYETSLTINPFDPYNAYYAVDGTGNGVVTEVFVADGQGFVVVKNTYVDYAVVSNHIGKGHKDMALASQTPIDYKVFLDCAPATVANGVVVIYNMYNDMADYTTIHVPSSKTLDLTQTYVVDNDSSWLKAGSAKYTYNHFFDGGNQDIDLLDRDELLAANGHTTQIVYFDDFGYVIYAEDPAVGSAAQGYMLVTGATYGGFSNDNGYYMTIKGYALDGSTTTVKGGFGGNYVYATKAEASDGIPAIGIYHYVIDTETGLYTLTPAGADSHATEILAGEPDALGADLVDGETVFVIANYTKSGLISGYTVKTGLKNIGDLVDAEIDGITGAAQYDWAVTYVVDDINDSDDLVDLVFVTGAKQKNDTKIKADATLDVFYLLDTTPVKNVDDKYDIYDVVINGKVTTLNVIAGYEFDEVGFYSIVAETNDYASAFESYEDEAIAWVGVDVVVYDGEVWEYASCQDGYVVLANNCKIVDLTSGACVEITAEDLEAGVYTAVIADWDNYGFATLIYVVEVA